jgi:hypothetical protein
MLHDTMPSDINDEIALEIFYVKESDWPLLNLCFSYYFQWFELRRGTALTFQPL